MLESDIYSACITKLCAMINEWSHASATPYFAYRLGNVVIVAQDEVRWTLSADEFRTFMLYRAVWHYLGNPVTLLAALNVPDRYVLTRAGTQVPFSPDAAQANLGAFSVEAVL